MFSTGFTLFSVLFFFPLSIPLRSVFSGSRLLFGSLEYVNIDIMEVSKVGIMFINFILIKRPPRGQISGLYLLEFYTEPHEANMWFDVNLDKNFFHESAISLVQFLKLFLSCNALLVLLMLFVIRDLYR